MIKDNLKELYLIGDSFREKNEVECITFFKQAYMQDKEKAIQLLLFIRDIQEGLGERRFFKICLKWLAETESQLIKNNFEKISQLGRYDDFYCFIDTPLEKEMFSFLFTQFQQDLKAVEEGVQPSLLGKWLKSENASSQETKKLANKTRIFFQLSHKKYRQSLSKLRQKITIIEKNLSQNQWDNFNIDKVPISAQHFYEKALIKKGFFLTDYQETEKERFSLSNWTCAVDNFYQNKKEKKAFLEKYCFNSYLQYSSYPIAIEEKEIYNDVVLQDKININEALKKIKENNSLFIISDKDIIEGSYWRKEENFTPYTEKIKQIVYWNINSNENTIFTKDNLLLINGRRNLYIHFILKYHTIDEHLQAIWDDPRYRITKEN